jgi:hypothetical protein
MSTVVLGGVGVAISAGIVWVLRWYRWKSPTAEVAPSLHEHDALSSRAAADLPADVVSLLAHHLPVMDALGMAATCVAWRDSIKHGSFAAFSAASGGAAPLSQTTVLNKVGAPAEPWPMLLLLSRLVDVRATLVTSCDPIPHEPAPFGFSEPCSMGAHMRNAMRQVRHPSSLAQVVDKLCRTNYVLALADDDDSFARRLSFEVGEPRSRCNQPLDRQKTLSYWVKCFLQYLGGQVSSTADLHERTRYWLGYYLVREWDEDALYRMISKMEHGGGRPAVGSTADESEEDSDDEYEREYGEYSPPSARAIGEAMHDCARGVFVVLSAIAASLNIFMAPEDVLRDVPLREALAMARISMAEHGATFELVQLLPEHDIKARAIGDAMRTSSFASEYALTCSGACAAAAATDAGEVEESMTGRWRIYKVDRSRRRALVCQYDDESRTAEVSFVPETMAVLRAGPILTAKLERRKNDDAFRVGMDPGDAWPTWYRGLYNDGDLDAE